MIYVSEFNIDNLDSLTKDLQQRYNISEITLAHWVKTINNRSTALLITFSQSKVSNKLYIPGEKPITVYSYHRRPLMCLNCCKYSRSAKNCEKPLRCQKCSGSHKIVDCERSVPECFYCGGPHRVGHRECPKQNVEENICKLKDEEKINYGMAKQKYLSTNPERKSTYADMLKAARRTDTAQANAFNQTTKRPRNEEENETTSKKGRKESEEQGHGESDADMKQIQREANEMSKQFRDEIQRAVEPRNVQQDETMELKEEEDLETVLREIYDSIFPGQGGMSTPKRAEPPKVINTPSRQGGKDANVSISVARIPTATIDDNDFKIHLEKYKIARVQYIPSEEEDFVDAILVAVAPLQQRLRFGREVIPTTEAENRNE